MPARECPLRRSSRTSGARATVDQFLAWFPGVERWHVESVLDHKGTSRIDPVATSGGGHVPEPELDRLSNILNACERAGGP